MARRDCAVGAARALIKINALSNNQGLAALRHFDPAYVSSGSKARITASQQQWPVHLDKRT
jgi:hypothetical protein